MQLLDEVREMEAQWYEDNIHITASIDTIISDLSPKFRALDKETRYKWIHTGLGVQALFQLAEKGLI